MLSVKPELSPQSLTSKKRNHQDDDRSDSSSDDQHRSKKGRMIGPSLPPPEAFTGNSLADSQSDDDDFGPALPPSKVNSTHAAEITNYDTNIEALTRATSHEKPQREAWMLAPPSSSDWSSKLDPTKLRSRKFNSGKSATDASQNNVLGSTVWTETPEQKRKRLEDEVMGSKEKANSPKNTLHSVSLETEARKTEARIQEYNEKNRTSSLYTEHMRTNPQEKEDDPSQRAFDREKDIAGPAKIGRTKRKEMLGKAADFSTRFSKGDYL